jgi:hypothetical protein
MLNVNLDEEAEQYLLDILSAEKPAAVNWLSDYFVLNGWRYSLPKRF